VATARTLDQAVHVLDHRRRWQVVLGVVRGPLAAGLLLAATGIVCIRVGLPEAAPVIPAMAVAGFLLPLIAGVRAWFRRRPWSASAGDLDRALDAHGLAMALASQPADARDPVWVARLQRQLDAWRPPAVSLRPVLAPALAGVVLAGAFLLPQQYEPAPDHRPPPLVERVERRLHDAIAQGILDLREQQRLAERLSAIRERAAGTGMDQASWEALDRVVADLDRQGVEAGRRLGAAIAAAEGVASGDAAAQSALADAVADLAAHHPDLVPDLPLAAGGDPLREVLPRAIDQALREGRITPEQAEALRRAGEAAGQPGQDAAAVARQLAGELEGLAGALDAQGQEAVQAERARQQGWGVTRGPGHAPLTRGEQRRTTGGFADGLAPGQRRNADGSTTLATTSRDPTADEGTDSGGRADAAAQAPTTADGRAARVAPRHRAVMQRYFTDR
jgi:hypothetical protein